LEVSEQLTADVLEFLDDARKPVADLPDHTGLRRGELA
jgi:hypothetical protein